ncbi:ATP synthase F0 subunit B [bacterium]|nr:ATP synthase F0 subunit B [bacterium]
MTNNFEFFAGLLCFAVLVYVLKRFLWGAASQALKERSDACRKRIREAEDIFNEAEKQSKEWTEKYSGLNEDIRHIAEKAEEDSVRLLEESKSRTEHESQTMVDNAKLEADYLADRAKGELMSDLADRVADEAARLISRSLDSDEKARLNIVEELLTKINIGAEHA